MAVWILAALCAVLVVTHQTTHKVVRRLFGRGTLPVEPRSLAEFDFSAPANFPLRVRVVKRTLDVVGASVGLLLAAPAMLLVALVVWVTSPGPVLFGQERVRRIYGRGETTFTMYKFRSMVQDAEKKSGPVWAQKNDARITKVGRLIRKTRLDELPQLFNVLMGDMSLVGPRPERPHFTSQLQQDIPAYEDRVAALKPGITGWAQVSCEYDASVDDVKRKLLYDLAYSAHMYTLRAYLKMEIRVLARTVMVVLTGKGAH
jgi:lipopolysaccharide/colanic/teichoic acid biosynthesis glycosyltransferase